MSVLEWRNEDSTILAKVDGSHTVIVEPGHADWAELSIRDDIAPFVSEPVAPWPSRADVNAERNRRMRSTFIFNGTEFNCDADSMQRITGAATLAGFAMGAGAGAGNLLWHGGTAPFAWIAADNSIVTMDAPTTFAFGQAAARNETLHIFAGKALKDMDPIPADYTADEYWP